MATAEQIKSLIRSHISEDPERFFTIALQVAAHEARQGHGELANDIRQLVDKMREDAQPPRILKFPVSLQGLLLISEPHTAFSSLVVPEMLRDRLKRILHEYFQREKLKSFGLSHRRKLLLIGPPGVGKTMTARVIAHELHLKLCTIQVDKVVTKFMGETSAQLRQVFDLIAEDTAVYLFDEFDAIGGERSRENDVGEMRRVLSAFLQFIEQDESDSIIIAATNSPALLDRALFRRFDDALLYSPPTDDDRITLVRNVLGTFASEQLDWPIITKCSDSLSHAEIDLACRNAVKQSILSDLKKVDTQILCMMIQERKGL